MSDENFGTHLRRRARLVREPTHFQRLLARFVKADGTFCGKLLPVERWWNPAIKRARSGYIMATVLAFGPSLKDRVWFLTPKGEAAAREAVAHIEAWTQHRAAECRAKLDQLRETECDRP